MSARAGAWVLALATAAAGAPRPMAEVWPYQVRTQDDGTLVYSYDLLPAKRSKGTPDAVTAHGQEAIDAFLKGLPNEVKVKVAQGPGWTVSAGRGPEQRPLVTAFALASDGPMQSDAALPKEPRARLRAALHPEVPKVMVGAAALVWSLQQLEDGVVAAAALETEPARAAFFQRVLDKALARAKDAEGDAKDGAQTLAARIAAATACLDAKKLPARVRADEALLKLATQELERLAGTPDALLAPPPYTWTPELTCLFVRARVLAEPFEVSRAGSVAALTFLDLMKGDKKLAAELERLSKRSARLFGPPSNERLSKWREAAKDKPAEAIEALSEFLDGLPMTERTPPGLFPLPASPFRKFLDELAPQERAAEFDELATAAQDGRLATALASEEWPASRDATLAALASADADKAVQVDGSWREQLGADFAMAQLAHHEARSGGRDLVPDDEERTGLTVRLMVPPSLEVEPVPSFFARAYAALSRLVKALGDEKLTALRALTPEGGRSGEAAVTEAQRMASVFRGLERLASPHGSRGPDADLIAARRFLASWRNDARLSRDVRLAAASIRADKEQRTHAAVAGVTRRELVVGYAGKPEAEVVGGGKGFELYTDAEQRYVVPVAVTVSARAPATRKPLDRAALKTAIDGAGRDPVKVEGAFGEALAR